MRWVQQQHEKIRKKRDENYKESRQIKFPEYDFTNLLRQLAPQARIQYRNTDSHSIFSDPLFKEQWYLVSRVCVFAILYMVLLYIVMQSIIISI